MTRPEIDALARQYRRHGKWQVCPAQSPPSAEFRPHPFNNFRPFPTHSPPFRVLVLVRNKRNPIPARKEETHMISDKQLAANRANANFSTGPLTPEGKALTRYNAVTHALTGQLTIVAPSEQSAFTGLSDRLTADLNPCGEQELQIPARSVRDTWRLHRAAAHEENIFALGFVETSNAELLAEDSGSAPDPDPARFAFINAKT